MWYLHLPLSERTATIPHIILLTGNQPNELTPQRVHFAKMHTSGDCFSFRSNNKAGVNGNRRDSGPSGNRRVRLPLRRVRVDQINDGLGARVLPRRFPPSTRLSSFGF